MKPIYVGQTILDKSKIIMYEFHYDYMKPKFNPKLCYMDTDSFIYLIKTDDFYKDISEDIEKRFDTSKYPKDKFPLKVGINSKVLGMMKDETEGIEIIEHVSLCAKTYSNKLDNLDEMKKAKGVKKCVTEKVITHENYKEILFSNDVLILPQTKIESKNHIINTITSDKKCLRSFDDKRVGNINTLAYGHYKIN